MNAIFHLFQRVFSHRQARRQLQAAADKCLNASQQRLLDEHLATCAKCRAYADQLHTLDDMLRKTGRYRNLRTISKQSPLSTGQPAQPIVSSILSRYRRYIMRKRFISIAGAFAFVGILAAAVILLGKPDHAPAVTPASGLSTPTLTSSPTASTVLPTKTPHASIVVTTSPETPLRFFTRLESDRSPNPIAATAIAEYYSRATDAAIGTEWPTETREPIATIPYISIAEAEQLAGFTLWIPKEIPLNSNFQGAYYEPDTGVVTLVYEFTFTDRDGGFWVRQGRSPFDISDISSMVGSSAIVQTVQINDVTGEFVPGVWSGDPGDGLGWVWYTTAAANTLRWQADDTFFELRYGILGAIPPDPYYYRDNVVMIAESLSK
jgi:hypothetical protein